MQSSDPVEFRRRLLRAGVPRSRVERLLRELEDHRASLREAAQRAGLEPSAAETVAARALGDQEAVLAAVLARPELRSFAHRRPWLAYGLLPSCTLLVAAVLVLLSTWAAVAALGSGSGGIRSMIDGIFAFVSHGLLWLLVPGTLWHAYRAGIPPTWPVVGALAAIGLGSALSLQMAWPVTEDQAVILDVTYRYGSLETLLAAAMCVTLVLPYLVRARPSGRGPTGCSCEPPSLP